MVKKSRIALLLLPIIAFGIHKINELEVDPTDFLCQHQKQIKGDRDDFFDFMTTPFAVEKLLPWLTRFKEADKRNVSAGKSYAAIIWLPFIGEKRYYVVLTDYKPSKYLAFEFSDILRQRLVIQTRSYHDRILLQTTIYFQRTSLIYQYTIGYLLRIIMKNELEKSMKNLASIYENLGERHKIPDFLKTLHDPRLGVS